MRDYERILAREGLAVLPDEAQPHDHAGWRAEQDPEQAEASAAEMDDRRAILHAGGFAREDRKVWDLYAQGYGRREIAKRLGTTANAARESIERTRERAEAERQVREDGRGLRKYVRAAQSSVLLGLAKLMLVPG